MNKNDIKIFSVSARRILVDGVIKRAEKIGIFKDKIYEAVDVEDGFKIKDKEEIIYMSKIYRDELIEEINKRSFEEVIDEVAYDWFIRFIAIRYMEVNDYLPEGIRMLSSKDKDSGKPDVIRYPSKTIEKLQLNPDEIYTLLNSEDNEKIERAYKTILFKECNKLNDIIPKFFQPISGYKKLLLPDELLDEDSIIRKLTSDLSEENFKSGVEIIGWMYQYYISEKKDDVFKSLQKNIKITKENIPAATQLFTPKWIVQYMVENTLGRLVNNCRINNEEIPKKVQKDELKINLNYYLEDGQQDSDVLDAIQSIKKNSHYLSIEDIKIIDPCMGSGHILVYAFDVLYEIYKKNGYRKNDIPRLILKNNLFGLDIDDRAEQLTIFALIMRARHYDKLLFYNIKKDNLAFNFCSIQESNSITMEAIDYLVSRYEIKNKKLIEGNQYINKCEKLRGDIEYLVEVFKDAKNYGSTLEISKINFELLRESLEIIKSDNNFIMKNHRDMLIETLPKLIRQAEIISESYDIAITNPPYMGLRGVNLKLSKYLTEKYHLSKYDMFSVYMEVCQRLVGENGFYAMITQQSWMFLNSFAGLREKMMREGNFINIIHLGARAFEENVGTIVQSVAFLFRNGKIQNYKTKVIDLTKQSNGRAKEIEFIKVRKDKINECIYNVNFEEFMDIPTKSIAYWTSKKVINLFKELPPLGEIVKPRQGIATSDNKRFLRNWFEVDRDKIKFHATNREEALASGKKWFPYNKGGDYRKWYGNNEFIINWENDGKEVKEYAAKLYKSYSRTIKNEKYFFDNGLTYTFISENMGIRYCPNGFIFDVAGSSVFFDDEEQGNVILAFLCSKVAKMFLDIMNPTYNIQVGDLKNIPLKHEMYTCRKLRSKINNLVKENINIAKNDWDSFEISWDFNMHPLVNGKMKLEESFNEWREQREVLFNKMKKNEETLNRIFIDLYGLQDELSDEMKDKDITFRKADVKLDIKSLISYAVGCMFGRYDIKSSKNYMLNCEEPRGGVYTSGLTLGNTYENKKKKKHEIKFNWFVENNILIITEKEYFKEDIVSRFIEFIKDIYGEENLKENLKFIANALGKRSGEAPRQTIRRYFLKDFYNDHLKIYKKRPIYWMFDSGKNDGFKALIYIHRYDEKLAWTVKKEYIDIIIQKYSEEIEGLSFIINSTMCSEKEIAHIKKDINKISSKIDELKNYDDIISYYANEKIVIDLDDGVKKNYERFQKANIVNSSGKEVKMNLFRKI